MVELNSMGVTIPVPATFLEWLWLALGINFGRSFGKHTDKVFQGTGWFRRRRRWQRWLIRRILDLTHHYWVGGLLMCYFPQTPEVYWFGVGLLLDDLPDIPRRALAILRDLKGRLE